MCEDPIGGRKEAGRNLTVACETTVMQTSNLLNLSIRGKGVSLLAQLLAYNEIIINVDIGDSE